MHICSICSQITNLKYGSIYELIKLIKLFINIYSGIIGFGEEIDDIKTFKDLMNDFIPCIEKKFDLSNERNFKIVYICDDCNLKLKLIKIMNENYKGIIDF